jgi:hypothetical protein
MRFLPSWKCERVLAVMK